MRVIRVLTVLSLTAACSVTLAPVSVAAGTQVWAPHGLPGAAGFAPRAGVDPSSVRAYVPGQLLVEFRAGVSGAEVRSATRGAEGVVSRRLPRSASASGGALILVSSATLSTTQLTARFGDGPAVARTSPNYLRFVDTVPPDDPGLAWQCGLEDVRAGDAWPTTTGAEDVVIADIDTGVDVLHPDLAANAWRNPGETPGNGVDDDANGYVDDVYGIDAANHDTTPLDDYGHGTHTAGIAAAAGDNGIGIAGLGWRTKIMALKFITFWGGGTDAAAIECIDYAVREKLEHGVNVVAINASWGGGAPDLFLRNAIARAGDAGIVFCAAAGNDAVNDDRHPHYPSSFDCPTILSVAATDEDGRLADFSSFGRLSVDLAAPGVDVLSTLPDGRYGRLSGTSMATPFVAGAVALCAAQHPAESAAQRVARVLGSVRAADALTTGVRSGGTLDVAAAVGAGDPAGDTQPPVTTALGAGRDSYDVSAPVTLFASDGLGGSGVATTQWRVDGGAWRAGSNAVVRAPRRARSMRMLEYRSSDRAGNVEAVRQLSLAFDTAGPGGKGSAVPLPPSPVRGGLDSVDQEDVYRLRLHAGETFLATADDASSSSIVVFVSNRRAHPRMNRIWIASRSQRLSFVVQSDATYYLTVVVEGVSGSAPDLYDFSYAVAPAGVDILPPVVRLRGLSPDWTNRPASGRVEADDGPAGSGVAHVETSRDEGLTWTEGAAVVVDAPADHSKDGYHLLRYRAADAAGNVGAARRALVLIDTQGPSTQAWGPSHKVRRGARAVVEYSARDVAPKLRACRLVVRSAATGRLMAVKRLRNPSTADAIWWDPDYRYRTVVSCSWPAGAYTVKVAGSTSDPAGNRWESATCERLLIVK